jgi:enterochelin esterase-like enzyme
MKKVVIKFISIVFITCLLLLSVSCGPIGESRLDTIGIYSRTLGKMMNMEIYVPKGYSEKEDFPVLYLFHGFTENQKNIRERGFFRMADILIDQGKIEPIIIVAPQIDNSYGLNSAEESSMMWDDPVWSLYLGRYEDYLTGELVEYIDSNYSTIDSREGRFIGGISMGGHTTVRLGFVHNDMYSKVGGHMPALWTENWRARDEGFKEWLYPDEAVRNQRDPLYIAQWKDLTNLSVYLDCGKDDVYGFAEGCEILYETLIKQGCEAEWHLNEGGHTVEYIEENVVNYLLFYAGTGQ